MDDLVTICIPTYRRPTMLLHCLYSCLLQDYRPLEIDISDNSPGDDTSDLVGFITPPEGITLRYWRNEPSLGPVGNQQKLFASVRGRRFIYMNDDDVLLPGAASAMAAAFALAPDVILAYGIEQIINPAGEVQPALSDAANVAAGRVPQSAGLRRDLLVAALNLEISHIGFMVLTDAAREVGIRDRAEVGLAGDTDFAIRLGQTYRGAAHVSLDRMTFQTRQMSSTLSWTELDVCWKLYDIVAALEDLSPAEARARDALLRKIAPLTLREHCLAFRRKDAVRVLLARTFPHDRGALTSAYLVGMILLPRLTYTLRNMATRHLVRSTT